MSAGAFYDRYYNNGIYFRPSVLTRYALSLNAKPFVILSGVSGTGKTKIAQLFDPQPAAPAQPQPLPVAQPAQPDRQRLIFTVTEGMANGDGRGNLPARHMSVVFEQDKLAEITRRCNELKAAGKQDNVIDPVPISVETPEGETLTFGLYVQRPASPLLRLRAKSKNTETTAYDSQPYLRQHYRIGEAVELEKIGPYRFRIVRHDDEGKAQEQARIAALQQQESLRRGENRLFMPVQSNWTDRTELLGFYNQIEGCYSTTPLLAFLQQAAEHPAVPHFLILDEMNLSKVEHYFSDFLSCMESRVMENGEVRQEPIHLHSRGAFVPADNPLIEQVPGQLRLPLNLYVTGTVNVDETTYMFSPKVLDRANVIEFNDVDLDLLEGNGTAGKEAFVLKTMPAFTGATPVSAGDYRAAPETVRAMLKALVGILRPHALHFGYRVAQEICRFINLAREHVGDDPATVDAALDAQIVQKVLPKFGGSQAQLEEPLRKVLHRLLEGTPVLGEFAPEEITPEWLANHEERLKAARYPLSVDKLRRMLDDLHVRGFTSFIG